MNKITDEEIEALKGKCYTSIDHSPLCTCKGTGKATIEIEKEWVEKQVRFTNVNGKSCFRTEKIPKYKVGDIIKEMITDVVNEKLKQHYSVFLKILSETEDKWKVCLG